MTEVYLNIRKVSCGILNITISLVYLKYPTIIGPLGYIEVRHSVFQACILRTLSFLIKEVLFYPLVFHTTGKSWQENKRYVIVIFSEI